MHQAMVQTMVEIGYKHPMEYLLLLKNHPFYGPQLERLTAKDRALIADFYKENKNLDKDGWFGKVNRLFIDQIKPKRAGLICELLHVSFALERQGRI